MSKIYIHNNTNVLLNPNNSELEIVERKFRGHPDSLAEMVAEKFSQLYIQKSWNLFPQLKNKDFPNFSADKVTLVGASTNISKGKYNVLKPVYALLIGKITSHIGNKNIEIEKLFKEAVESVLDFALNNAKFQKAIQYKVYAITLAGVDHNSGFYNPKSTSDLLKILKKEKVANDTVYVVAYSPLSITEKLIIQIENVTASDNFRKKFPDIGTDIKCMIRRRGNQYDITLCLPIDPENVTKDEIYKKILRNAKSYLLKQIILFLFENKINNPKIKLWVNTKDTPDRKYYAIWGTALSKGDIGAVGRGNRRQGFISGNRPSTNEAVAGKNPNHFSGIIYQMIAEEISRTIYIELNLENIVYITSNNGDKLNKPNSIDILVNEKNQRKLKMINEIVKIKLKSVNQLRDNYIQSNIFEKFLHPSGF